MPVTISINH